MSYSLTQSQLQGCVPRHDPPGLKDAVILNTCPSFASPRPASRKRSHLQECVSTNKRVHIDLLQYRSVVEVARCDGAESYLVQWTNGHEDWETSDFRHHVNGKDPVRWALLMSMASRYNDSPKTLERKAEQRDLYAKGLCRGVVRRSPRDLTSSRAIDAQKLLEPAEVVYNLPRLSIERCQACDATTTVLRCRGWGCSAHLCLHHFDDIRDAGHKQVAPPDVGFYCPSHGGPPLPKTAEVTLHGLARSRPTGFHIVTEDDSFAPRISVEHQVVSKADADVLFIDMHTRMVQPDKFREDVEAGLSGMGQGVHIVFTSTCWLVPDVQVKAMKEISGAHPAITFVLFRVASLVPTTDLLNQCVRAGDQTTRYPAAPPYLFLAHLFVEQRSAIIFERGVGPLRVGLRSMGVPTCECSGKDAAQTYGSKSSRWWKEGVRRKYCRQSKCPSLLLVPDAVPEPTKE